MFSRRTLLQLTTKLAITLGALFLVGVLLAAIPNHRTPVMTTPAVAPLTAVDDTKPHDRDGVTGVAHKHATAPTSSAFTKHN